MPAREIPLRRYTVKKPDTFTNVGGKIMEMGGENGDVVVGPAGRLLISAY